MLCHRVWSGVKLPSLPALKTLSTIGSLLLVLVPLGGSKPAQAQPITPAPDGIGTIVTPNGNQFTITGGTSSNDGANLFHSFQQFGLDQAQVGVFLANPTIQNILGRVVGGAPSVINGLIQVTGTNANLYLMNPAGIIFGSTASLNVSGSFLATTATGIGFGDQWLTALGSSDYANLIGSPTSFAFAVSQPGAIVNAGNLTVDQGQALSLLGGTVVSTGSLSAPGGQVTVASVPGENLVRLNQAGSLLNLEFIPLAPSVARSPSPPSLPQLLTGGNLSNVTGLTVNSNGQVELTGSQVSIPTSAGSATVAGQISTSGQTGGTVQVLGDRVNLVGANINATGSSNGGSVLIGGDYKGQGTIPNANHTDVSHDSVINADSTFNGNGGRVIVWAEAATGFYGTINARGGSQSGNGGFAEVSGKQHLIFDGSVNLTATNGKGGTLLLDPTDIIISNGTTPGTTITQAQLQAIPNTMDVLLEATNNIIIGNLDQIDANQDPSGTNPNPKTGLQFAKAPDSNSGITPGTITLTADSDNNKVGSFIIDPIESNGEPVLLQATGRDITISGASITVGDISTSFSDGKAGDITLISTGDPLANSGNISTNSLGAFHAFEASGDGGDITINSSGNFTLNGNIAAFVQFGNGSGGTVSIQATGDVALNCNGACIESFAGSTGKGGLQNSGDITIASTNGSVRILGTNSPTLGSYTNGDGSSGNITISARNDIITSNLLGGDGSSINLSSREGSIDTSSGTSDSFGKSNAGLIETGNSNNGQSPTARSGGSITLDAFGDVRIGNIDATGIDTGGTINISSRNGNIITIGDISTFSTNGNGGSVTFNALQNIVTGNISSRSNAGNGGNITFTSTAGDINTTNGELISSSTSGAGGAITLNTPGNISVGSLRAESASQSHKGGAISVNTNSNFTLTGSVASFSLGGGSDIEIRAVGNITLNCTSQSGACVESFAGGQLNTVPLGDSGNISLVSQQGSITVRRASSNVGIPTINASISEVGAPGKVGAVNLQASGDIVTGNIYGGSGISIVSEQGAIDTTIGSLIAKSNGNAVNRNSGNVSLSAAGNISTGRIESGSASASGGTITLTSGGSINTTAGALDSSVDQAVGNVAAGAIALTAVGDIITGDLFADVISTPGGSQGTGGNITLSSTAGNINTSAGQVYSFSSGGGSAGAISLSAPAGSIQVNSLDSFAVTQAAGSNAGTGGNIALSATAIAATGELNAFSESDFATASNSGAVTVQATNGDINIGTVNAFSNAGRLGGSGTAGTGGQVSLTATGNIQTGNLFSFSNAPLGSAASAGAVQLLAGIGNITTGNIQAFSASAPGVNAATGVGGNIALTSNNGVISTGNLDAYGNAAGGNVTVVARTQITTGTIDTSATIGNGGNVLLDPLGDIQVTYINAQGGTAGRGGNVDITTQSFFRATGGFSDRNNQFASISTAGGIGGGDITIRHGGQGITPFIIGDASVNGTAGILTTGLDNLIAAGNRYYFTYRQPGVSGDIQIISVDPLSPPEQNLRQPLDDKLPNPCAIEYSIVCRLEEYFTSQYDRYLNRSNTPIKTLSQIRQELRDIEQATGAKPALIYVFFTPGGLDINGISNQLKSSYQTTSPEVIWQFTALGLSVANAVNQQVKDEEPFKLVCELPAKSTSKPSEQADVCHMELVLVTADADPILRRSPNSPQSLVLSYAREFRRLVKDRSGDDKDHAAKFYKWLLAPLARDLSRYGVDNLVFVMDSGLRTLPLAAIREGTTSILDDYSVGMMPSMSLTDTRYVSVKQATPLLMGASEFGLRATPLPAVPLELSLLQEIHGSNQYYLNETFTEATLASEGQRFQLIHLATHGSFQSGDPDNSYILLGGNEDLRLTELQQFDWSNPPIELLVLAACETAEGDQDVELGFAGVAVQAGVKTSLASLWVVPDDATVILMTEFYNQLREAPIKAQALRLAQQSIRKDEWKPRFASLVNQLQLKHSLSPVMLEIVDSLQDKSLVHPRYWASFMMIGNPW